MSGYTASVAEAGRYSEEQAKKIEYKPQGAPMEWVTIEPAPPPDYNGDLNAMHEAEKVREMHWNQKWVETIVEIALREAAMQFDKTDGWDWVILVARLSAAQRAEAFLRVHNQWEGEQ